MERKGPESGVWCMDKNKHCSRNILTQEYIR